MFQRKIYNKLLEWEKESAGKTAIGSFTTDFDTINKYVDVENNNKVKEVLNTMCGLGESLENKGFEKGYDTGKLIQLIELVAFGDITEERASEKAGMTLEVFRKKMQEMVVSV